METNEKIKQIRIQHDMTQNEFAASLGISRSALTQLEAGHTKPSFDVLEKLIDQYDVDVSIFFNTTVPEKKKLDNVQEIGERVQKIMAFYDEQYGLRYNELLEERLVQQVAEAYPDREKADLLLKFYEAYVVLRSITADLEFLLMDPLKRYANKLRKQRESAEEHDDRLLRTPDSPDIVRHLDSIMDEIWSIAYGDGGIVLDWVAEQKKRNPQLGELIFFTTPLSKLLYSSREELLRQFEILLRQADALDEVSHYYQKEHFFYGNP
ncbi:helix-turn-helix domain-containing protein [Chryseobacterium sp. HSC-36S06]|uniref:helix-turn-helix domain-containing protein n=1 Tax=Chryseobacterium sp. HSC-36S06 TaxID=2910970 RepID=UPI00209C8B3D|nr:helix-turn-helix transcriptional regulator [Chryseobacterium sp. HSC-36S06]MCP2037689.1 transcriptional regulator with XRE-family HTH domain [Chryseobacterium sp. HSC-36S06]